jgi:hypothetical protein
MKEKLTFASFRSFRFGSLEVLRRALHSLSRTFKLIEK